MSMSVIKNTLLRKGSTVIFILGLSLFSAWFSHPSTTSAQTSNATEVKISGIIVNLPNVPGWVGEWTVFRTKVVVTTATKIEGVPFLGSYVEIKGTRETNGSIKALVIEVKYGPLPGAEIHFVGRIEELPSTPGRIGKWKINNRTVIVTDMTKINQELGPPAVGAFVAVIGKLDSNGDVVATDIAIIPEVNVSIPLKFTGKVEKLSEPIKPGEWVVSGRTVVVGAQTIIKEERGKVMIGSLVEVTGILQGSGKVIASLIEVKNNIEPPTVQVTFRGIINSLPATTGYIGDWKVSGRPVRVTSDTKINEEQGKVAVGAMVEVKGVADPTGTVLALSIVVIKNVPEPGYIKFLGVIKSIEPLPAASAGPQPSLIGTWKVGDRTVKVLPETKINQENGPAQVGALVEVEGILQTDGSVVAKYIEVKHSFSNTANYIRFFGLANSMPQGNTIQGIWDIGGKKVNVTARTRIRQEHGPFKVGAFVEVEGNLRSDEVVDAFVIEVERDADAPEGAIGFIDFYGEIKSLPSAVDGKFPGEWVVGNNNKKVKVDDKTRIDPRRGEVKVGAFVEVRGYLFGDGSVKGILIIVRPAPIFDTPRLDLSYVEFIGKVTKLPEALSYVGEWEIDETKKVNVGRFTVINRERAKIEVGATVEIVGAELPNGEVDAKYIEVEHGPTGAAFVEFQPFTSVNAGSYQSGNAASSIIAAFGNNLATTTASASNLPLPTTLGGVSVMIDGRPAGLFFVSPNQINYLVPDDLLPGTARVTVLRGSQVVAQGELNLAAAAPSVFTADGSGQGTPAGLLLRIKQNGQTSYESLARFDSALGKVVPAPIVRQQGDQLFLVFFGTGLRGLEDLDGDTVNGIAEHLEAWIGDKPVKVHFAGVAPDYVGLEQINLELPGNLSGTFTVLIKVRDGEGHVLRTNLVTITVR